MRSATVRRFALVAALVLMLPVWGRPGEFPRAVKASEAALIDIAGSGNASAPAIRRHVAPGVWLLGSRADNGRTLVAVILALLWLAVVATRAALDRWQAVPSPLARRRHVISLRAPPLRPCI